tara:strand:- start:172 stop:1221 length:1050 start_codon:yes stop_codon:yes gene_type:complete
MNKLEALKRASDKHNEIKNEIISCFKNNNITIDDKPNEFLEITLFQLRNFIESKIVSKNEVNMGLAFPIGINGDCIVAHYTPTKTASNSELPYYLDYQSKVKDFKILKIDYGIHINGYIIDKAFSINIHKTELEDNLIKASDQAVNNILKNIGVDARLNELADSAKEIVESYEDNAGNPLKIVKNVYSHNIDRWRVHANKFIMPDHCETTWKNYDETVKDGEQYAIEIYASNGKGEGALVSNPQVHSHFKLKDEYYDKPIKLFDINALNVMADSIKHSFKTLPFCPNFIKFKIDKKKPSHQKSINLCQQLQSFGIVESYPPITELDLNSSVSQIEKNVLVSNKCKNIFD